MDNLTRDAIASREAGTSYGKWKAMHPQTKERRDEPPIPEGVKAVRCKICGKPFVKSRARFAYCSYECRSEGARRVNQEGKRRRRESRGK